MPGTSSLLRKISWLFPGSVCPESPPGRIVMKTAASVFLVAGLLLVFFPRAARAEIYMFWLGGQSNAMGRGDVATLSKEQAMVPKNVEYYFNGTNRIYDLSRLPYFGADVSLVHKLSSMYPDDTIVFIKYAVGGSSMIRWCPEPLFLDVTRTPVWGDLYRHFVDIARTVTADRTVTFAAAFWVQWEADTVGAKLAEHYAERLGTLIAHLRQDFSNPDLAFVFAQAANNREYTYLVAREQLEVARSAHNYLVPTMNLSKKPDGIHFDEAALLELGNRMFDIYSKPY